MQDMTIDRPASACGDGRAGAHRPTAAVMQPYAFPYLGYFCLIAACDHFVFYDDVNFIQKGWINRNRIALGGQAHLFTIPLANGSQNQRIGDIALHGFEAFRRKFLRQVEQAYRKAPCFDQGMRYVDGVLSGEPRLISDLAIRSVMDACALLGLETTFSRSSERFAATRGLARADRLIEITRQLGASRYVNSMGGRELYDKAYFRDRGIELCFVDPRLPASAQDPRHENITGLSIIDVLMHNRPATILDMIRGYELA